MTTVFDIRGQVCPSALLVTLREVNKHFADLKEHRETLQVLTDSRKATATIPAAVANMGLKVEVQPDEGHYVILIHAQSDTNE